MDFVCTLLEWGLCFLKSSSCPVVKPSWPSKPVVLWVSSSPYSSPRLGNLMWSLGPWLFWETVQLWFSPVFCGLVYPICLPWGVQGLTIPGFYLSLQFLIFFKCRVFSASLQDVLVRSCSVNSCNCAVPTEEVSSGSSEPSWPAPQSHRITAAESLPTLFLFFQPSDPWVYSIEDLLCWHFRTLA